MVGSADQEGARSLAAATLDEAFAETRAGSDPDLFGRIEPVCELLSDDAADRYDARLALVGSALGAGGRTGGDDAGAGGQARIEAPAGDAGASAGWPESVMELDCGAGGLLARLADRSDRSVGLASGTDLAAIAARHAGVPVVAGDPIHPPLYGAFEAVVGLDYPTARATGDGDPARLFGAAHDLVAPGSRVVLDALVEPRATLDDPWSGEVGGYRVDRSVAAGEVRGDRAELAVEYDLTRVETGETAETTDHLTLRLFAPDDLVSGLRDAGFVDVRVDARPDDPGGILAVARRPG